ncbi:MAG: hypothetical protein VKO44_04935 [Cyanobacteriota bacterium]|nr:hypothetical protein [Cyanobacteriota bacterium]
MAALSGSGRGASGVALALLGVLAWSALASGRAQPLSLTIECRVLPGPWQPCAMEVREVGQHWFVVAGGQRIEFLHAGQGVLRMRAKGRWSVVTPRWNEDQSLCWGQVCVRGDLPLD